MTIGNAMSFPKIISLILFACISLACAKPLPILGDVPEFSLQDQLGAVVTKKDFAGSVWVVDFIYTGCGGACPLLTQRLSEVSKQFRQGEDLTPVRLASITVDPLTDTPERLREYAERFGASHDRWLFLTGEVESVRRTVSDGFKLAYQKTGDVDVFHSEKLVLIDPFGRIRGYYDADAGGLVSLRKDAERLRIATKNGGG